MYGTYLGEWGANHQVLYYVILLIGLMISFKTSSQAAFCFTSGLIYVTFDLRGYIGHICADDWFLCF